MREEGIHRIVLVVPARKVVREATTGEVRRDLGVEARRAADTSDIRTCKSVAVWCTAYKGGMEHYTYRMQGTWGRI